MHRVHVSKPTSDVEWLSRNETNKFLGKMGTRNDSMAVIDSRARVFGVSNLRVVDASSFPILVPGHPSSTICKLHPHLRLLLTNGNLRCTGRKDSS